MVTPDSILAYCMEHLEGVVLRESWGERGIYYNPGETLPRGVYILTIKEKDGENDRASQLDREGVYRVNLGQTILPGAVWGTAQTPAGGRGG